MQVVVEGNEVILYSDIGGRIMILGPSFNTDECINKVVRKAIEYGKELGKREVRNAMGIG